MRKVMNGFSIVNSGEVSSPSASSPKMSPGCPILALYFSNPPIQNLPSWPLD
jgi:adenylyl- and sulfurtransferase ThiI